MGRVWPSRCTRTSTLGPIKSKAAVSACSGARPAITKKRVKKPIRRLRNWWAKSIKNTSPFYENGLETRSDRTRNHLDERICGSFMVLRSHGWEQLITESQVQWQDKTADIRIDCELRRYFSYQIRDG